MPAVKVAICFAVVLAGCAHVATPKQPTDFELKSVESKSYVLDAMATASVGEPLIRVKQYTVLERGDALKPSNDFSISGGLGSVSVNAAGQRGVAYPVVGLVNVQGKAAKAIQIPGSRLVFGILPDGSFSGVAASFNYWVAPIQGVNVYKIEPESTLFLPAKSQQILEDYPFTNHEILFSGRSTNDFKLLYREYSVSDLIRPALSQEVTYPTTSTIIRFRNYHIEVISVSSESITYKIVSE